MGNQNMVNQAPATKCKVNGCLEKHGSHFCKNCKNFNSDHYSYNCPSKKTVSKISRGNKANCSLKGCQQNHNHHYCKVCHDKDSDHFASQCPFGISLFHGTSQVAAISIQKTGFRPSATGCLGAGVYFTNNYNDASKISKRWGNIPSAVIECRLEKDPDYVNEGLHGKWFTDGDFTEYVVRENYIKRLKIVKIHKIP